MIDYDQYRTMRLAQLDQERDLLEYTERLERRVAALEDMARPNNYVTVRLREELWRVCEKHGERVPPIYFAGIGADLPVSERQQAEGKAWQVAADLADWLPGVWADYQAICHEHPDEPIPIAFEQMIHTIQAKGFALRDALEACYKHDGNLAAAGLVAAEQGESDE